MAIHYGFQDKFMLSLNLTKHRNKHFPERTLSFQPSSLGNDAIWLQKRKDGLKSSANRGLHRLDDFTDKHLGNVSSRKLQIAPVSGHPWAPTGKLEFPSCFVTAFKANVAVLKNSVSVNVNAVILTSYPHF